MSHYDYLIVGAGLYGAVCAREAVKAGKSVLVIDKRPNIAGNVYTEEMEGINVHIYGAHIFHTNNKTVWDYITRFSGNDLTTSGIISPAFRIITLSPILISLPFI